VCILCSTDFDESPEAASEAKVPGRYCAACHVASTFLRAGRYWIDVSSSVPGIRWLDEVRNALAFDVVDTGSPESRLAQGRHGVIAPVLKWKTTRIS
jgi:lipopolysaccharide transport system ATP-binding protein